ncbi:MAG: MFS transporter [Terriglobia bacterium]
MPILPERKTSDSNRFLPWPKRVDVTLLSFLAMVIAYCDRVNLSMAAPMIMREYHWDTVQMGWVLSGFFMGYTFLMIPVGRLVDLFGPRRVFAASMAWWSVFTAVTPLARSVVGLTIMRAVMGVGQCSAIPAINRALVNWFPRREYSRAFGFSYSGSFAGPILAFPLASLLLQAFGWRSVFFAFAFLGFFWLPLWVRGVSDRPESCSSIKQAELDTILSERPHLPSIEKVPWLKLLRLPPYWGLLMLHFSSNWFIYVIVSWLPSYLMLERHFSLANTTIGSTLPFATALLSCNFWSALIDHASKKRPRTLVRKLFLLPFACAGGLLLMIPRVSSPIATVFFLCIALMLYSSVISIYTSGSVEIAPRYAGTVGGIQNCFGNFAGVLVPVIVGYVVKISNWGNAFWVTAAVTWLGIMVYAIFGKSEKLLD